MELIRNNVFGPIHVPSMGIYVYYVSFIVDFSMNTWLYFLKRKYEFLSKFKDFKALMENQIGRKIKLIRIDNGCELYVIKEFDKSYK